MRVAAGGIGFILVLAAALGWWTAARLATDIGRSVTAAARTQALTTRFTFDVADELRAGEEYLVRRNRAAEQQFVALGRDAHLVQAILVREHALGATPDQSPDAELVARIDNELSLLETVYARSHRLVDLGDVAQARQLIALEDDREAQLRSYVAQLGAQQTRRVIDLGVRVRQAAIARAVLFTSLLFCAIGLVGAFAWRLSRSITRPLGVLVAHADALRHGARDTRTATEGLPGEFQVLAAAMNQATQSLASLAGTEAALHQAEKLAAIGTLISGVAHELNNPLQSILLTTENLHDASNAETWQPELATIREQVCRARAIIGDLLATVRSERVMRDSAPLEHVLRELESELAGLAERHGASLQVRIDGPLQPLLVDRVAIAQVVTNLVANGAHAAGNGGHVRVSAARRPLACEIVVEDTGPGIRHDILSRIFEPFFSTKIVGQGTGLGLSVSRGLVESMGGTLTADAHWGGPETGARFRVVIPIGAGATVTGHDTTTDSTIRDETAAHTTAVQVEKESRRSQPGAMAPACLEDTPRMLVIDDEPAIQGALQRFFARRGWVVDCASHGLEALARIEARLDAGERFALILCDLRMPTMSGLELHDVLASRHPEVLERVVFLSGDLVSEDVREFIDRTSCRIFIKPLDVSALQRAADDALRASASAGNTRRPEVARAS